MIAPVPVQETGEGTVRCSMAGGESRDTCFSFLSFGSLAGRVSVSAVASPKSYLRLVPGLALRIDASLDVCRVSRHGSKVKYHANSLTGRRTRAVQQSRHACGRSSNPQVWVCTHFIVCVIYMLTQQANERRSL